MHTFLNIPHWEQMSEELLAVYQQEVDDEMKKTLDLFPISYQNLVDRCPKTHSWMVDNDVDCDNVCFHINTPGRLPIVHIDGRRLAGLNFPVQGIGVSTTNWYTGDPYDTFPRLRFFKAGVRDTIYPWPINETVLAMHTGMVRLVQAISSVWIPTNCVVFDRPGVINTKIWHGIDNRKNNTLRVMASFGLRNQLPYKALVEKLTN